MSRLLNRDAASRLLVIAVALACLLVTIPVRADFSTAVRTVFLNDQPIRYHLMGAPEGPLAIVLGGGPGFSSWNLEPVQRRLAKLGYRTAIMDMLGIGENAKLDGQTLTGQELLDTWVSQIEALHEEEADDRPAVLLGHSWGALMALLYTRVHTESVQRLVLLNPVDPERRAMRNVAEQIDVRRSTALSEAWDREQAWEQRIGQGVDSTARHQIERSLPSYFLDYSQGERYAEQFDASDFSANLNIEGWRAYEANPVNYGTINQWGIPIGFIGCRQDLLMPTNLNVMQSRISFDRITLLEGCVHFPWEEVPSAFDAALAEHVGQTDGRERRTSKK